jgi:hypothetical protein
MPEIEDELTIEDDDEIELPGDDPGAYDFLTEEKPIPTAPATSVDVKVDTTAIGETIADALKGGTEAQTAAFRSLAKEFIDSQPRPAAPTKTKEQIASRNAQLQALLMDTSGDVDIEETIKGLIKPMFESEIEGTISRIRPQAENIASGQGSALVRDFKRSFKDENIVAGVNDKLWDRYNAEIDKLIPPEHYTEIASWSKKRQDDHFAAIGERAYARVMRAAQTAKTAPSVTAGGGGAGGSSKLETALRALPRAEQREAIRIGEAFARAKGFREGTKEWNKAKAQAVSDYMEDEE